MPWHDKNVVNEMNNIKDHFGFTHLVETGTDEGIGARFWARRFEEVYSCELREKRFRPAQKNTEQYSNIHLFLESSVVFVPRIKEQLSGKKTVYILDAHGSGEWPLFKEVKALRNTSDCAIIIHDFHIETEPQLGYDAWGKRNISATLGLLREDLLSVNPNFVFYHNSDKHAQLYSAEEILQTDLFFDENTQSRDRKDWSSESGRRRGVLFALPAALPNTTLLKYKG